MNFESRDVSGRSPPIAVAVENGRWCVFRGSLPHSCYKTLYYRLKCLNNYKRNKRNEDVDVRNVINSPRQAKIRKVRSSEGSGYKDSNGIHVGVISDHNEYN